MGVIRKAGLGLGVLMGLASVLAQAVPLPDNLVDEATGGQLRAGATTGQAGVPVPGLVSLDEPSLRHLALQPTITLALPLRGVAAAPQPLAETPATPAVVLTPLVTPATTPAATQPAQALLPDTPSPDIPSSDEALISALGHFTEAATAPAAAIASPPQATSLHHQLTVAAAQLNKPYRYGATGPEAFDCSGLVVYVYGADGVNGARSAADIYNSLPAVSGAQNSAQAGDLLFYDTSGNGQINHVGIALGDGRMIHASSSQRRIVETTLALPYWQQHFVGLRRLQPAVAEPAPGVETASVPPAESFLGTEPELGATPGEPPAKANPQPG